MLRELNNEQFKLKPAGDNGDSSSVHHYQYPLLIIN